MKPFGESIPHLQTELKFPLTDVTGEIIVQTDHNLPCCLQ